jgi:hypothetical protein
MKKKWFCVLGFVLFSILLQGADEGRKRLLLGSHVSHGFFLAPECKWTRFQNQDDMLIGSRLAWVVDHRFILGLGGYAALNWGDWDFSGFDRNHDSDHHNCQDWHGDMPRMAYGGLILGFNAMPNKPMDIYGGVLIGGGYIHANKEEWANSADDWERNEFFWAFEPEVQLLLKFTRFLQVGVGGSYRFVSGVKSQWTSNSKLQGAGGLLSIRLGWM